MRIGAIEFDPSKLPWRTISLGLGAGMLIGLLMYAWFEKNNRELMGVLNTTLEYYGNGNDIALYETQLGPRVHGAVVALCARYPWLSPLFGYRDNHTAQMMSYMYKAYKAQKSQLIHAAWLYETDVISKADSGAESKYQQVLFMAIPGHDRPDADYKPRAPTAWDVVAGYVMPIASFLMMALMLIPK